MSSSINRQAPSTILGLPITDDETLLLFFKLFIEVYEQLWQDIELEFTRTTRGTATFDTAGTVVHSHTKGHTDYMVELEPRANETYWITGKTSSQFTINSSNSTSTATIGFVIEEF